MTSRIIVCGCCFAPDDPGLAGLRRDGHWVQRCTTEENLTREEGRGLFLMRQLMDRVESFRNKGNVIRLTLRRP